MVPSSSIGKHLGKDWVHSCFVPVSIAERRFLNIRPYLDPTCGLKKTSKFPKNVLVEYILMYLTFVLKCTQYTFQCTFNVLLNMYSFDCRLRPLVRELDRGRGGGAESAPGGPYSADWPSGARVNPVAHALPFAYNLYDKYLWVLGVVHC